MSKVLVLRFNWNEEIIAAMDDEAIDAYEALNRVGFNMDDAVNEDLEIVEKSELDDLGEEGDDYKIIEDISMLGEYGYTIEDVMSKFDIDVNDIKRMGISVDDEYDDEE